MGWGGSGRWTAIGCLIWIEHPAGVWSEAGCMAVDRCVCHEVSFRELLSLHREQGLSFEELKLRTGCCTGCGTCEPYVRLTLETGRVVHPVLDGREVDAIMARAGRC